MASIGAHKLPVPASSAEPNIPSDLTKLATAVDSALTSVASTAASDTKSVRDSLSEAILFSNAKATAGNAVTLSADVSSFKRITIIFMTDDKTCSSCDITSPAGKRAVLSAASYNTGHAWIKSRSVQISGKSITTVKANTSGKYMEGQMDVVAQKDVYGPVIAIIEVIGWKI